MDDTALVGWVASNLAYLTETCGPGPWTDAKPDSNSSERTAAMSTDLSEPQEVTDERIYADLNSYQDAGIIEYVLPTEPLGEQWIVGWDGQILKFLTKEGIVGFLTGIQVCAMFVGKQRGMGWPS